MQRIVNIYIMLGIFIYIILSSVVYMVILDVIESISNRQLKKLDYTLKKEVLRQLNYIKEGKEISKFHIEYVAQNLKKKRYIKGFINAVTEFNEDKENYKFTRIYISNFEAFVEKFIEKNKKKDETIRAYCTVVLGEFKLSNYQINSFLIKSLNTNSMYLRVSALEAISKIGNLNNFLEAIKYISDNDHYINSKILIDILNQFDGDKHLLNKALIDNFNIFNNEFKKSIIEHFKNNKVEFVKESLLEMLKDENSQKEVRISIIKYFSKINDKLAQEIIIKLLNEGDWEYRAVSASALSNYKGEKVINVLLKSITDKNWYVRYNSAISLLQFNNDIVDLVFLKEDKYSKDIIFYAMFMENRISYEEYLEKSRYLEVIKNG